MRRSEREVKDFNEIVAILEKCEVLRLALCVNNEPYIVPMNFAHETVDDKLCIYLHGAKEGKKIDFIRKNPNVCFESDCSYKTITSEEACKWSAEYQSVIGSGKIYILEDDADKMHGMDLLMKHYGFQGKPNYPPQMLKAVNVMKIEVSEITGKQHILTQ